MPPEAPAPATPPPMPTEPITVEEALAQARLEVADQLAADEAEEAAADAEVKKANAERGPDGKFKAAEAKEKTKAKDGEPAEATAETKPKAKEAEEPEDGNVHAARRLFKQGKIEEAVKIAFGVDPEDLKLTNRQWSEVNHKIREGKREAAEKEQRGQQLMAQAQQLVQAFVPFAQAKQAYDQGDYDTAMRLAFGEDGTAFQKKLIAQIAQTKDPAAEARIARLEHEAAQRQAELQRYQQLTAQQQQEQAVKQHVASVAAELKESGDARFEAAAGKKVFLDKVLEIQREHWDKHTQQTLPPLEAAELAWEDLYGDLLEVRTERGGARVSPERGRANRVSPERGGVTREGVRAKAGTNLRHSQAAEAAPEEDLQGDELMEFFIRKAKSQQAATG